MAKSAKKPAKKATKQAAPVYDFEALKAQIPAINSSVELQALIRHLDETRRSADARLTDVLAQEGKPA